MSGNRADRLDARVSALTQRLALMKARQILRQRSEGARQKAQRRREDTRRKIELGGLVIVAELEGLTTAELAGWLFVCRDQRLRDPASIERMSKLGEFRLAERKSQRTRRS